MNASLLENRIARMLIILGPLTSLAISPFLNFDPINPVKNLFVTSFAFCIFALLIRDIRELLFRINKLALIFTSSFVGTLLIPFFFSSAAKSEQFWGTFGRNNGLLNYVSLAIILLATIYVNSAAVYRLILQALVITSIPMTLYCLVQIAGKDPFPWSAFAAFGTLGNINFLSAFLGLSSLSSIYFIISHKSIYLRLGLVALIAIDLGIIFQTGSIQGLMMFSAGISLYLLFYLAKTSKYLGFSFLGFLLLVLYFVLQAFLNKGPLASAIYQPSITYRGDYMAAGINMLKSHLWTGVGLDSYGDWYRAERGVVSTFRTGYGRTSNVAHNIYIDMGANGGLLLLASFTLLNLLVLFFAIKAFRVSKFDDNLLNALTAIWIVYQTQALISIAQIGVTIWGWLVSGALIGYSTIARNEQNPKEQKDNKRVKPKKVTLDAGSSILAFLGFAVGLFLTFIPFKIDMDFRGFSQRGDLKGMVSSTRNEATSVFFYTRAQFLAISNNYPDIAFEINSRLREKFPREITGWFVLENSQLASPEERLIARQKVRELDPYFYCYEPNYEELMARDLLDLPIDKQRELAIAWGADASVVRRENFSLSILGSQFLSQRFKSFCA